MQNDATIYSNGTRGMLINASSANLTMQNNASVHSHTSGGVYFQNGTFIMQDNASVYSNTIIAPNLGTMVSSCYGGGIYILDSTFIMRGDASVYDNSLYCDAGASAQGAGAGIYSDNSTFIMNDNASVYGNTVGPIPSSTMYTSGSYGGGVAIYRGVFRISGGIIYGSDASEELKNTALHGGAALNIWNMGNAQRGTFDSNGEWQSEGNLSTTNNTIRVMNGQLW